MIFGPSFNPSRWIDWRRRDVRDALVVLGLAITTFAFSEWSSLLDATYRFVKSHENWELGGLMMTSVVLCVVMIVFGFRRMGDLSKAIDARRAAENQVAAFDRQDPLTGLPNLRLLVEKLGEALRDMKSGGGRLAALIVDIDALKPIHELHGPLVSDKTLVEFAARIVEAAGPDVIVARVGDSRFAVVQPAIRSLDNPTRLARGLIVAAGEPFLVAGSSFNLSANVGIAVAPDDGCVAEDLIRRATVAWQRAKDEGRSSVRFFVPEMEARLERRMRIERELRIALDTSAIAAHYQPIVAFAHSSIVGFEALARWKSPALGWVSPPWFIAVAEECGLIGQLSDQLLRRACSDAQWWPAGLRLAINISATQLQDRALAPRILSILADTGFDPRRLELEITESTLVDDIEKAAVVIAELRQAGVSIALDGFGSGHSTLAQLLALPFDKIKIARSLVHRLGKDPKSEVVVRVLVALASGLNLRITAEGIERPEQLERAKAAGCVEGQGFLFGKPIPPAEIPAVLRRFASPGQPPKASPGPAMQREELLPSR